MHAARGPGPGWWRAHPVLADVVPVLALAVLTVAPAVRFGAFDRSALIASVLVWLPALGRRRHPEAAFAATLLVVLLAWGADGFAADRLFPAYASVWLVLFAVADRCTLRRTWLATAATEVLALASLLGPGLPGEQGGPAVVPLTTLTIAVAVSGRNRQTRRAYTAGLEDRAERLEREQEQLARVAVAEERARIAREVHDVVAHNISVMIALADGATYVTEEPRAGAAMAQVAATGRQALSEMGGLLGVLRDDDGAPVRSPAPGLADLETLVDQVRAAGLTTELAVRGSPVPLGATAQLAVYRLVQEALTNTLKHARDASRARVELCWGSEDLAVDVCDDGAPVTAAVPGHGITGMGERFAAWGGTVDAGPEPAGGWRVRARMPLAAPAVLPA